MLKFLNERTKGFTLIELLIVIVIIGILASLVLVSLAGARNRAKDARIQSNMGQVRSYAEDYYTRQSPNSYDGLCADTIVTNLEADSEALGGSNYGCFDPADAGVDSGYCAKIQLNSNKWWCVDSGLLSKQYNADPTTCAAVSAPACE